MISAISLFSGMGGDTLGINNAGGKVIAFNEFDKHATSCHELNFPDTKLIYDDSHKKDKDKTNISLIRDEVFEKYAGKVDLIFAGHPCFVAGTKVLTYNGYKNIEDVEITDKLLTHSGKFQNIVNLQNKIYNGKMYSFRIKYHPEEIHCTQEHPYYVRKRIKTWNCERNTYDITYNEPEWKHAKDITKDDLFGMVINERAIVPDHDTNNGSLEKYWHAQGYSHGFKTIPEWIQNISKHLLQYWFDGFCNNYNANFDSNVNFKFGEDMMTYNIPIDIKYSLQRIKLKLGYDSDADFIDSNYAWFECVLINTYHTEKEKVYNFEVENDNSYIVENTIVHNCQGFSQGGKKLPDDPRNTLFREFARSAKLIKPKFIIGENVDGLLSRKTATGENYIDVIVSEFNNIGYNVYYQVCHAVQYGVPQLRKRLVYVGIRQDIDVGIGIEGVEGCDDNSQSGFHFPEPLNDRKTNLPNLKNIVTYNMTGAIKIDPEDFDMNSIPEECILRNMEDDSNEDSDNIHPYLRLKAKTRGQTYNGKTFDNTLSFAKRESPIHAEVIDIRAPSKTIICTYDHQPRLFVPLQNNNGYFLRPLIPDELKQIQGFPADFKLNGSVKEQIRQIGNAAPPPLVCQIVKQLIAYCGTP